MVVVPHATVGAFIGLCFGKMFVREDGYHRFAYFLTFAVAFASHFVLDAVPHTEYVTPEKFVLYMRILADCVAAGGLIWFMSWGFCDGVKSLWSRRLLFIGAFAAIFPDILAGIKNEFDMQNSFLKVFYHFHSSMHTTMSIGYWPGIGMQAGVATVALVLIFFIVMRYDL